MLMFSVIDKSSFDEATRLAVQINLHHRNSIITHGHKQVVELIGTKTDLGDCHRVISEASGLGLPRIFF
jgi:hypothetical protein